MRRVWFYPMAAVAVALSLTAPAFAGYDDDGAAANLTRKDRRVLQNAPEVLQTIMAAPDSAIPDEMLERAECVLVFPNVTKGAFIVGGRYGRGVATCRESDGSMGSPAFFTVGGASVGWQFGGKQTDLVLLVMNKGGMNHLLQDKFTIGGEASAAVGPVGREAQAATDAQLGAQILAWSRSQGLFVGASIDGAVVKPDEDANLRLYGRDIRARDILAKGPASMPAEAAEFVAVVDRLTATSDIGKR